MTDSGEKKPLGRILLQQRLVTPGELDQLLEKQRRTPGARLASTAATSGTLSDLDVLRALSEQLGVPAIDLGQVVVPLTNLKLIPHDVAKQYLILPFSVKDEEMWLAMADPHDRRVLDEIEFVTGRTVAPYVALHEHLQHVVDEAYQALDRGEAYYIGPNAPAEYLAQLGLKPRESSPPKRSPTVERAPDAPSPRGPTRLEPSPDETDFSSLMDSSPPPPRRAPTMSGQTSNSPTPANPLTLGPPPLRGPSQQGVPTGLSPRGPTQIRNEISSLDPAFGSRVGPLPTADSRGVTTIATIRTVLVVDDEDDIRRMLRRVLMERGYRVVEAARGTEALQAVRDNPLDCILLDAMLPEIHGFDICRRIKSSQKYGHIPIIMVSAVYRGWRFAEDLREAYGVTAFLEKPFKISDVIVAVERAIEGKPFENAEDEERIGPEAAEALQRGMDAYKHGDVDRAIEDLKHAVTIEPHSFRLHYHLGLLYGRRDAIFEAIQAMETALHVSTRNFAALKNLAVLYQRAGFKHKAVESWERAMRSAPDEETRRGIKEHLMGLL